MTARSLPPRLVLIAAPLIVAVLMAACSSNGQRNVEANEFFRPALPGVAAPAAADASADASADAGEQGDQAAPAPAQNPDAAPSATDDGGDEEPQTPAAPDDGAAPADGEGQVDLADNVVRRYLNDSYGYSLELVCAPFCNVNSSGIDRVGFLADNRQLLINITVRPAPAGADLAALEAIWREDSADNDTFTINERAATVLPADGVSPALLLDWEIDRRALGGFQEHYLSLITQVGPIAYFVNAGGIAAAFPDAVAALRQAIDTFYATPDPPAVPGIYAKWDFVLPYDTALFNGELGDRAPLPSFDSGVFVLQPDGGGVRLLLIWESIAEPLFDRDTEVTAAPGEYLAGLVTVGEELERGDRPLPAGVSARYAIATTRVVAGGDAQVATYAWYCADGGRAFTLISLDAADARGAAQQALDGFRCTLAP